MKPCWPGAHPPGFDQRGKESFAVIRAAHGTAQHDAGAVAATLQINFRRGDRLAGGEPTQPIAARAFQWRTEAGEIALDFGHQALTVSRRSKETQRFQSAIALGDCLPDLVHAAANRSDDPQTGNDWETHGLQGERLASMNAANVRTD